MPIRAHALAFSGGCLVAMQASVDYDIEMVKGIKTAIFGGEGKLLRYLSAPFGHSLALIARKR